MAYINADHWALAVPIARTHSTIGAIFVTQNAYPREALVEALLRFVEEDLSNATSRGDQRADPLMAIRLLLLLWTHMRYRSGIRMGLPRAP